MHDNDVELMRRATAGDRTAFSKIVHRYESALRRVAQSQLGTADAAEDVVQETFLAAYKSRHSYDPRYTFRTWLWTILINQCRRYAGRQARQPQVTRWDESDSAAVATESAGEPAPLARLLAAERREIVEAYLHQLSAVQAEALRLRFFRGLKFQEIADRMQCTLGTAKNRVRWGLLRLAGLIQNDGLEAAPREPRQERATAREDADDEL